MLKGRSVIVAMCLRQLGSLLPDVVAPSILAAFLIPEWHLTGGPSSASTSMAAFSVLAAGILLGPVALYWSRARALQG